MIIKQITTNSAALFLTVSKNGSTTGLVMLPPNILGL